MRIADYRKARDLFFQDIHAIERQLRTERDEWQTRLEMAEERLHEHMDTAIDLDETNTIAVHEHMNTEYRLRDDVHYADRMMLQRKDELTMMAEIRRSHARHMRFR